MSSIAFRRRAQLGLLLGPVSLFLAVFFLGPLAIMIVTSFLAPGLYGGVEWTWYPHNYGRILGFADPMFEDFDPVYIAIFLRSLKIAALTVVATLLVCYPAAFCISRLSERWKNFCLFLITLPFFTSLIVRLFIWSRLKSCSARTRRAPSRLAAFSSSSSKAQPPARSP